MVAATFVASPSVGVSSNNHASSFIGPFVCLQTTFLSLTDSATTLSKWNLGPPTCFKSKSIAKQVPSPPLSSMQLELITTGAHSFIDPTSSNFLKTTESGQAIMTSCFTEGNGR